MVPIAERTVVHVLRRGAAEHPDRVAVRDADVALTYAELERASAGAGGGLRSLGVGFGEPVLIMMNNNVDHVLTWFGASWIGAVEVPLNTASMPPQIAYIARDCGATVLVVEAEYVPLLREIVDQLPSLRHLVVRGRIDAAGLPWAVHDIAQLRAYEAVEPVALKPADVCGIMYTSGTTGAPKGVVVTQAQTYGRNGPLGIGSPQLGDVVLVVLPIYHVLGQCRGLYNGLIAGGTVILRDGFSASRFFDLCREFGVTYTCVVGVMAEYLLAQPERDDDADNPLRRISLGTTIRDVDAFRSRFAIDECYVSYGLTEAGGVLVGVAREEGCGYLRDDFLGQLVDEQDQPVPDGRIGELVLRPTEPWTTMVGYLNRPDETVMKWRNLWLHTGDLMTRQADGRHIFHGRLADRIRLKGENIAPASIEEHLAGHPDIAECAVVGVEQTDVTAPGDQDILVAVVPAAGVRIEPVRLIEFLATRVPYFAVPRYVRVTDELPRTDSTRRVQRGVISGAGFGDAWDRVEAGVVVRRGGIVVVADRHDANRED